MKNVTILVMGPTLGFKLAVIWLYKASVHSQKTQNVCRFCQKEALTYSGFVPEHVTDLRPRHQFCIVTILKSIITFI
jgi:hypothetical protein